MSRKLLPALLLAASFLVMTKPMFAHHGLEPYDKEHPVTLTGTVTQWDFVNPHVRVHFDVKEENGMVTSWVAESTPPQKIYRGGWNRNSLKPGDSITVTGLPLKNGKKLLSIKKLVAPNGQVLDQGAE
jgi:uncharacterized protein DUF6152